MLLDHKKELFEYYLDFLSFNLRQYETHKFYERNRGLFDERPNIYPLFSSTFLRGHILGLAVLLDPEETKAGYRNFSARIFDIYGELNRPEIKEITEKIIDLRRKWLAHQDLDFVLKQQKIKEVDLKKDIEEVKLFDAFVRVAKNFARENFKVDYYIDERLSQVKKETAAFLCHFYSEI